MTELQRRKHDRQLAVNSTREFLLNCYEEQLRLYMKLNREAIEAGEVNLANSQGLEPIQRLTENYRRYFALIA